MERGRTPRNESELLALTCDGNEPMIPVGHVCEACHQSKVKCDRSFPCGRCKRLNKHCRVRFKRVMGRPRKIGKDGRVVTCLWCYKSKVKCDGGRPCNRCKRRGVECRERSTDVILPRNKKKCKSSSVNNTLPSLASSAGSSSSLPSSPSLPNVNLAAPAAVNAQPVDVQQLLSTFLSSLPLPLPQPQPQRAVSAPAPLHHHPFPDPSLSQAMMLSLLSACSKPTTTTPTTATATATPDLVLPPLPTPSPSPLPTVSHLPIPPPLNSTSPPLPLLTDLPPFDPWSPFSTDRPSSPLSSASHSSSSTPPKPSSPPPPSFSFSSRPIKQQVLANTNTVPMLLADLPVHPTGMRQSPPRVHLPSGAAFDPLYEEFCSELRSFLSKHSEFGCARLDEAHVRNLAVFECMLISRMGVSFRTQVEHLLTTQDLHVHTSIILERYPTLRVSYRPLASVRSSAPTSDSINEDCCGHAHATAADKDTSEPLVGHCRSRSHSSVSGIGTRRTRASWCTSSIGLEFEYHAGGAVSCGVSCSPVITSVLGYTAESLVNDLQNDAIPFLFRLLSSEDWEQVLSHVVQGLKGQPQMVFSARLVPTPECQPDNTQWFVPCDITMSFSTHPERRALSVDIHLRPANEPHASCDFSEAKKAKFSSDTTPLPVPTSFSCPVSPSCSPFMLPTLQVQDVEDLPSNLCHKCAFGDFCLGWKFYSKDGRCTKFQPRHGFTSFFDF